MQRRGFLQILAVGSVAPALINEPKDAPKLAEPTLYLWRNFNDEQIAYILGGWETEICSAAISLAFDQFYATHGVFPDAVFGSKIMPSRTIWAAKQFEKDFATMKAGIESLLKGRGAWYVANLSQPRLQPVGSKGI